MVSQVLKLFSREFGRLEEAALLLGISALVSQLLALFRDRLLASAFGAGRELDIYYAAFRVPDLIYVGVASLVSLTVVIPVLVEHLNNGNQAKTRIFLNSLFTVFSFLMMMVAGITFFLLPLITKLTAPGFTGVAQDQLVMLSRLLLLSPLFLGLSNFLASITQSFKKFFVYALSPVFYNLGIIIGILWFAPRFGLLGLGLGVVLGAVLHLLVQGPTVWSLRLWTRLIARINWLEIRGVLTLSLPRTLALSCGQLVIMILVGLASLMTVGSVAVFNFAYNLQSVPLAIIGMSYSVAAFPTLVWKFKNGEHAHFLEHVIRAARHIIFWSFPFATLLIVFRAQVIRVILGSGRFDWFDTRLTAAALAVFSVSLVAQSLILLLVRGYYAAGITKQPLLINCCSSAIIILAAFFFRYWFESSSSLVNFLAALLRLEAVPGLELLVLPLAFSLGSIMNLVWLWRAFSHDFGHLNGALGRSVGESLVASFVGGVAGYLVLTWVAAEVDQNTFAGIFTQGLAGGLSAIAVMIGSLQLVGNREIKEIGRALGERFWRTPTISPEPEEL